MGQQQTETFNKEVAEGKIKTDKSSAVKLNLPRLCDSLLYIADEKKKNFIAVPPSSIIQGSEHVVKWEDTRSMTYSSFKAFSGKNKSLISLVSAESKKTGKKKVFVVSKDEVSTAKAAVPNGVIVAVDKRSKQPIDGEIKVE